MMGIYSEKLEKCYQIIDSVRDKINHQHIPSNAISYNELYNVLYQLIPLIPDEFSIFRDRTEFLSVLLKDAVKEASRLLAHSQS